MNKKLISWILKAPLILLIASSFAASLYVYIRPIQGISITIATPIALGIILVLYIIGEYIRREKRDKIIKELKGGK